MAVVASVQTGRQFLVNLRNVTEPSEANRPHPNHSSVQAHTLNLLYSAQLAACKCLHSCRRSAGLLLTKFCRWNSRGDNRDDVHYPTRPVDKEKAEAELSLNIKKATSPEETAPKAKCLNGSTSPCNRIGRMHVSELYVGISSNWDSCC